MKRLMVTAVLAGMAYAAPALADETVDSLKAPAVEACKKEVGGGTPSAETDKLCVCMVDQIVTVFGDDAATMLKIVTANLQPSDTAEIAKLLGVSEEEAKTFVAAADEKMDSVQSACMPQ